jgi:hypothetical protein
MTIAKYLPSNQTYDYNAFWVGNRIWGLLHMPCCSAHVPCLMLFIEQHNRMYKTGQPTYVHCHRQETHPLVLPCFVSMQLCKVSQHLYQASEFELGVTIIKIKTYIRLRNIVIQNPLLSF